MGPFARGVGGVRDELAEPIGCLPLPEAAAHPLASLNKVVLVTKQTIPPREGVHILDEACHALVGGANNRSARAAAPSSAQTFNVLSGNAVARVFGQMRENISAPTLPHIALPRLLFPLLALAFWSFAAQGRNFDFKFAKTKKSL